MNEELEEIIGSLLSEVAALQLSQAALFDGLLAADPAAAQSALRFVCNAATKPMPAHAAQTLEAIAAVWQHQLASPRAPL